MRSIPLYGSRSVDISKLLVEQPRRRDGRLLPVCGALLLLRLNSMAADLAADVGAFVETLTTLALPIPDDSTACAFSRKMPTAKNWCSIAVKPYPALNDFQQSVEDAAFDMIMTTAILGYLSPFVCDEAI